MLAGRKRQIFTSYFLNAIRMNRQNENDHKSLQQSSLNKVEGEDASKLC